MKKTVLITIILGLLGCNASDKIDKASNVDVELKQSIEEIDSSSNQDTVNGFCTVISGFAESIMTLRQEGVPQEVILEFLLRKAIESQDEVDEDIKVLNPMYVMDAYKVLIEKTEQDIEKAIKDFQKQKYEECIEKSK